MSQAAPAMFRTTPRAVAPPQIPEALRGLWRTCSAENGGAEVARSLAINFLAFADASREALLRDALERLRMRTPCRAFLLVVDPATDKATAEVSATTRTHGTTRDIVLEEIAVRLPERAFDQIPGLVRPLLVNDLPNHLFWAAPWPRIDGQFDELSRLCDHVVVDTRLFAAPARELPWLDVRRERGQRLTDLTWLRLRPWRRALAEAFERVQWQAGTATTATIRHGGAGTAAAALLARWLEQRLAARTTLAADAAADSGTCPTQVDVRVGNDEVQLLAVGNHVEAHVTTKDYCYVPFRVPVSRGRDGDLLAAAIDLG